MKTIDLTGCYIAIPETGCWLWTRAWNNDGYGRLTIRDEYGMIQCMPAHRFMYQLLVGPIPKGLVVRHKCDVKPCVNPDHLIVGTQKENVADSIARGRRGKLTTKDREYIRTSSLPGTELAYHFGVSYETIRATKRGRPYDSN